MQRLLTSMQPYLVGLVCLLVSTEVIAGDTNPPGFQDLLAEAGLSFTSPAGFEEISLQPTPLLQHEKALRPRNGQLEIRYAIRPLSRIEID